MSYSNFREPRRFAAKVRLRMIGKRLYIILSEAVAVFSYPHHFTFPLAIHPNILIVLLIDTSFTVYQLETSTPIHSIFFLTVFEAMAPIGIVSAFFPPSPTFTDKDLPSLNGKVYIVTGSATGVGYETAKILYSAGATVYIGARSAERCREGIKKIEDSTSGVVSGQKGRLESMIVDLADLPTVKLAAQKFLATEVRLDGLIQNAAVMMPPAGSKDKYVS